MTEPKVEVIPTKGVEVIIEKVWFARVEGVPTTGIPFGSGGEVLINQTSTSTAKKA